MLARARRLAAPHRLALQPVLWSPRTGAEVELLRRHASLEPGGRCELRWHALARYLRLVRFHALAPGFAPACALNWQAHSPAPLREVNAISLIVAGVELLRAPVRVDQLSRHPIPFDSPPINKHTTITIQLERQQ